MGGAGYAYGLRLRGLEDVVEVAVPAGSGDDGIRVEVRQCGGAPPAALALDPDRGVLRLRDGRHLAVDRAAGTATFHGPRLSADVLAHPYLGPVATVFGRWHGREAFHGGAFVAAGRAWVLLGPREAGKSSLLGGLAARGHAVVTDDILVTDGRVVYAGPRCVDLRDPLPGSPPTHPVRGGTRSRLPLPPLVPRVPLGGWLFLCWGDEVGLRPVPAQDLLRRLAARRARRELPSDPGVLLRLATRPGWELTRPRDWSALEETCRLLGELG
jgi:hypothetical protein